MNKILGMLLGIILVSGVAWAEDESCVVCHSEITPGQVADWRVSAFWVFKQLTNKKDHPFQMAENYALMSSSCMEVLDIDCLLPSWSSSLSSKIANLGLFC